MKIEKLKKSYLKRNLIIGIVAVLITVGIVVNKLIRNKTNKENVSQTEIQYNKETGEYYILDESTNEIKASSTDESSLQIYIDNPDYNPNPLVNSKSRVQEENLEEYTGIYDEKTGKYVNELTGKEIK